MSNVKKPYLIQRGTINRPLGEFKGKRLSEAVDMDYMGSSEFEFGALPRSFRRIEPRLNTSMSVRLVDEIKEGDKSLRVYSSLNDGEFTEYKKHLIQMREDKIRLKERSCFSEYSRSRFEKFDFWWDIENDVMWSFDKNFMNRVHEHVCASLEYMNKAKST